MWKIRNMKTGKLIKTSNSKYELEFCTKDAAKEWLASYTMHTGKKAELVEV